MFRLQKRVWIQTSSIFRDLNKLQEGIGEKIGMFVFFMTIFSASLINAFIHGWELTLIILSVMPVNKIFKNHHHF